MKRLQLLVIVLFLTCLTNAQTCPTINFMAPTQPVKQGDIVDFSAEVGATRSRPEFKWTVKGGTIISGQGTTSIKVNAGGSGSDMVKATLDISGLFVGCANKFSDSIMVIPGPEKIYSGNYTTAIALTVQVKKFVMQTNLAADSIKQTAFIYVYGGATTTAAQLKQVITIINSAFTKEKITPSAFRIVDGGKKKLIFVEMYRMKAGASEPNPSK